MNVICVEALTRDYGNRRGVFDLSFSVGEGETFGFLGPNGAEFLRFIERYRGIGAENRRRELLERFELDPRTKIKKMSKGTKRKLAITAALMQNRFVELLKEEKRRGKTIFLSSHMFEEVERTCDRVGMIRSGELVTVDTVDALRKRHLRSYTVSLPTEQAAKDFAADFDGERDGLSVKVAAKLSLEDIFMDYYGGDKGD